MSKEVKQVVIYTDGACEPNPGPGGYGVVLIFGNTRKELSGGFCLTTNNRMEIFAAIKGLESLKEACQVTLYSDSKYLVNAMTQGWVKRWRENGWWRTKQEKATNADLWERLFALGTIHQVEFVWVKGHAGNRDNERCDELSLKAQKQKNLPPDDGYERRSEAETENLKITHASQPCRKCSTPVVKKKPRHKPKPDQAYYFEYYLYCPNCHTMYMVEEAKRELESRTLF